MDNLELKKLSDGLINIVKEVGEFVLNQAGKAELGIETKSENSFVTFVDKEAERRLVNGLQKLLPEATFLTEEETVSQKDSALQWIIDPIDGTTNFIQNIPIYSTSVALKHNKEIVLGVVNLIPMRLCFHAIKDGGAFQNDEPMEVSRTNRLDKYIVATGFPYERAAIENDLLQSFEKVLNNVRGVRRLGSAAIDLAFVASGRMDAYFETNLNPWDVAAGILLVNEAGGRLSDYHGGEQYYSGSTILASNGNNHNELLALLESS